ncbi:zinc-dependent metalloprotease [Aeromicrobium sp. YIM 150415]|uniref:zinc-dependent metalloprotease n=1 Tax=Aeromicrobium sp. YIM 150415 TaxID=2803912 RepID=UPI001965EFC2|nr:zinc-dependent metalloprotease [Aeromicrobium sp. YIM 150415]MBM9463060.1 zinc-dependent metalloprotease [Aeromicrobium sp. YIM 150415]
MAGDDPREEPENPFKGTPLENLFGQMGPGQVDLSAIFGQMQRMFEPHEGSVNYRLATDTARQKLAASGPDPSPGSTKQGAVDDAVRLAEMWLDRATELPSGVTSAAAWSRAEWIESTMDRWKVLVEPIASNVVSSMGDALPQEAQAMAGPFMAMLTQAGGAMFGQQVGQGIGELATEVLSSTDIGLPMGPDGVAALLPHNIAAFAEGLDHTEADALLYVALRECAHQRLYAHAPWLRTAIIDAVTEFGRGSRLDTESIEEKMRSIDPGRPDAIAEAMEGGLFEPETTPEQQHAKERLELLLALAEGWVDEVVGQATADTMPSAVSLGEAMRRRRVTAGPAEQTFAALVGLELRPRRLRDATTLFSALRDRDGVEARDRVWSHPDLLPDVTDLDDPLGYSERHGDGDFDAALGQLLDDEAGRDEES